MYFLGSSFENIFWILEQPVNNKGFSSIQFFLREFLSRVSIKKFD